MCALDLTERGLDTLDDQGICEVRVKIIGNKETAHSELVVLPKGLHEWICGIFWGCGKVANRRWETIGDGASQDVRSQFLELVVDIRIDESCWIKSMVGTSDFCNNCPSCVGLHFNFEGDRFDVDRGIIVDAETA